MPLINGNMTVRGTLNANSLLFKEITDIVDMTRGVNINLVDGKVYYKIDAQNYFEFVNRTELLELIGTGGSGSGTISSVAVESKPDIMNLINTTFFSINDFTKSYFINLNFDFSNDLLKAGFQLDKVLSSIYKNGIVRKAEYQVYPLLSMTSFKNTDVMNGFSSVKFDNSSLNEIDQTSLDLVYFSDLLEQSALDTSTLLDYLLITNTNDHTLLIDNCDFLSTRFFSLNWLNFKIDLANQRSLLADFHNRIFNKESILYFFENYVDVYKYNNVTRIKLYFFDYRYLIHTNVFHLLDYAKAVYNSPETYSNTFAQNILSYKEDHTDITSWIKDYTAFDQQFDADELIKLIFDSDTNFGNNIDQSSLDLTVSIVKQNLLSLNDPNFNELDLTSMQAFTYDGYGLFTTSLQKMKISDGEVWVPLLEVDFPLDSYFYFIM